MNLFDLYARVSLDTTGFDAGISAATAKGASLGTRLSGVFNGISSLGASVMKSVGVAAGVGVAALGAFTKSCVETGMEFDASMSKVAAISGATGDDFQALRDKAIEMGEKTKFSANESAEAMTYMAMAGWKTEDMLEGIEGIMNLAAASGEDLASVSDIVTDALTAFGMQAEESGHFADILAAAAANSNTNVGMMGESFKYVAPLMGSLGYSAEDTAVALGLMANSGIKASQGGTALRNIISNMANPSEKMAAALDALGVSLEDETGRSYSLMEIMQQLREGFNGGSMSSEEFMEKLQELNTAFENGDISEEKYEQAMDDLATSMYGVEGAERARLAAMEAGKYGLSGLLSIVNASEEDFNALTESIYNCNGAAEEMAATMMDNLQGDITLLNSALGTLQITISDSLTNALRAFTQEGTEDIKKLTQAFNEGGWEGLLDTFMDILANHLH